MRIFNFLEIKYHIGTYQNNKYLAPLSQMYDSYIYNIVQYCGNCNKSATIADLNEIT